MHSRLELRPRSAHPSIPTKTRPRPGRATPSLPGKDPSATTAGQLDLYRVKIRRPVRLRASRLYRVKVRPRRRPGNSIFTGSRSVRDDGRALHLYRVKIGRKHARLYRVKIRRPVRLRASRVYRVKIGGKRGRHSPGKDSPTTPTGQLDLYRVKMLRSARHQTSRFHPAKSWSGGG